MARLNSRCRWNALTPTSRASVGSVTRSAIWSTRYAAARLTARSMTLFSFDVGRQRLHGRYPARWASVVVPKNVTFSLDGLRDEHDGRQKMCVELTPYTNCPSYDRSRCWTARQAVVRSGSVALFMELKLGRAHGPAIRKLLCN